MKVYSFLQSVAVTANCC